jgi:hypothetical protein
LYCAGHALGKDLLCKYGGESKSGICKLSRIVSTGSQRGFAAYPSRAGYPYSNDRVNGFTDDSKSSPGRRKAISPGVTRGQGDAPLTEK